MLKCLISYVPVFEDVLSYALCFLLLLMYTYILYMHTTHNNITICSKTRKIMFISSAATYLIEREYLASFNNKYEEFKSF